MAMGVRLLRACAAATLVPSNEFDALLRAASDPPAQFAELQHLLSEGPAPASAAAGVAAAAPGQFYPCRDPCCDAALSGGAGAAGATKPPEVISEKRCTASACLSREYRQVQVQFEVCPAIEERATGKKVMLMAPLDSRRAAFAWECGGLAHRTSASRMVCC